MWPAIAAGAFLANATTFGSLSTSSLIAGGNTLEALITVALLKRFKASTDLFEDSSQVVLFACLTLLPGTMISATMGVGGLLLAGFADPATFPSIWLTWWLGDVGGQLLVTPFIVLWAKSSLREMGRAEFQRLALLLGATIIVGLVAFSPLLQQTSARGPLGFVAIGPLLWAALRHNQRDTATVALVLSAFAIWGTVSEGGPFAQPNLNDSFLLMVAFVISTAVPSLVLSADVAARRLSEERHRALVEHANDIVATLDLDLRFTSVNPAIERILGFSPAEVIGRSLRRHLPQEQRHPHAEMLKRKLQGVPSTQYEVEVLTKAGVRRVLEVNPKLIADATGKPVAIHAIARDITERKEAKRALETSNAQLERSLDERNVLLRDVQHKTVALTESRARLAGVVDSAMDAIISIDERHHVVLFNAAAERMFQRQAQDVLGRELAQLLPARYRAAHRSHINGFAQTGVTTRAMGKLGTLSALRADGTEFPIEASISQCSIGGERLFTVILRDIAERKRAENALAQSQRMEAIGQLAGGIAHDFNNVLAAISSNLDSVTLRSTDEKIRNVIQHAMDAIQMGANLTRRLLLLSRRREVGLERLDLNDRVRETSELLKRSLGEQVTVSLRLSPDPCQTSANAGDVDNAIINLAINARDAMPSGGMLTIETRLVSLDADVAGRIANARSGEYVMLTVSDTGDGMSPEVLKHAMEPFFTTKEPGKGTGLGLATIHSTVRQSGGFVAIDSTEGEGTSVHLYFPKAEPGPIVRRAAPSPKEAPLGDGELILLVEDNDKVREATANRLESLGYAVLEAKTGPEAITLLKSGDPVVLVFSDVVMPGGMTGYDVAEWVQSMKPDVKVLQTTASSDVPVAVSKAARKIKVLGKPYTREQLACALREALDG